LEHLRSCPAVFHHPPIVAAELSLPLFVQLNFYHSDDIAWFDEPSPVRQHVQANAQRRAVQADELLGFAAI
jgi:hypothetical protein